jgi:hypothetical protein
MSDTSDNPILKDALLDDAGALLLLYAEFAPENRQLAESGLATYARLLDEEDRSEEALQRMHDSE